MLLDTPELVDGSRIDETKLCKYDLLFEKGGVEYVLSYQKTYNVRDLDGNGREAFSSLNPQRPDIVLTVKANGNEYSYLFDAKYRVWTFEGRGQGPGDVADATTRDAIDAMYRYRDAILYRMQKAGIKREIIGAYVLYPGRVDSRKFSRFHGCVFGIIRTHEQRLPGFRPRDEAVRRPDGGE